MGSANASTSGSCLSEHLMDLSFQSAPPFHQQWPPPRTANMFPPPSFLRVNKTCQAEQGQGPEETRIQPLDVQPSPLPPRCSAAEVLLACLPCLPARSPFLACALRSTAPSPAIAPLMTLPYPNHEAGCLLKPQARHGAMLAQFLIALCASPCLSHPMEPLLADHGGTRTHTSEIYQPLLCSCHQL